jgi:hypothetical protein
MLMAIALSLTSCGNSKFELSEHPEVLREQHVSPADFRLLGIGLGDSEERIPQALIRERTSANWIICGGGARFRISNGRIVEFRLDEGILEKFEILRENQVELMFGKADRITDKNYGTDTLFEREYIYIAKHMIVFWDLRKNKLDGIIISK